MEQWKVADHQRSVRREARAYSAPSEDSRGVPNRIARLWPNCPECGRASRTGETACPKCGGTLVMSPEEEVAWSKHSTADLPILGQIAAVFVGIFSYIVSYGLLLTFGLIALFGFAIGFATLPSATDVLFPSTPTPAVRVTPTRTLDNRGIPVDPAQASAATKETGSSPWAGVRTFIRLIVFGAAFLALWPGWYGGYTVVSRLRRDAAR